MMYLVDANVLRMIAATALQHDLIVATRNIRDFKKAGVKTLNPFD